MGDDSDLVDGEIAMLRLLHMEEIRQAIRQYQQQKGNFLYEGLTDKTINQMRSSVEGVISKYVSKEFWTRNEVVIAKKDNTSVRLFIRAKAGHIPYDLVRPF